MITVRHLARVVEALNQRPRNCLADRIPAEVFARTSGVVLQPRIHGHAARDIRVSSLGLAFILQLV